MATKKEVNESAIEKVEKIPLTGEVILKERIDEDTKEKKYSVQITVNNPFADLFKGGAENEYNQKLYLSFKETQGKAKAQFNYKADRALATCAKLDIMGCICRKKFFDQKKYKSVKYIAITIKSPFDDSEIALTIANDATLGLVEMFADERLKAIA